MEEDHKTLSNIHQKHSILPQAGLVLLEKMKTKYHRLSHERNIKVLHHFSNCEWMRKRGKGEYIDFNSKERAKIRAIFKELDRDGSGALGLDELYEPLLALGLVENKEQVKEMMSKVDINKSGVIEFEEFIKIIKQSSNENNALISFFKNLSKEEGLPESKDLSFNLVLSSKRRELMMQTYLGKNISNREQGRKVMSAFALELKDKEVELTKMQRLVQKKERNMKQLLERKNGLRLAYEDQSRYQGTFITSVSRPKTSSGRPMTRRDVLRL